ncbi:polycomb protein Scm [Nematostella vectensis]|uniref:polycomb protein Scm n=1 Tax=Nematostella vectensis TaxID=45351 RepID=UPI0020773418|nr:polycomb protein Scm [Nematostella vectensis]XP_032235571.2 polycomb protein Scm [Nematostella vectensis]XP_048587609.1 polycomb protein Scm [Nematostella vectensis]
MASLMNSVSDINQPQEAGQVYQKVIIPRDRNGLYGLHISNLSPQVSEHDLRTVFQAVGRVFVCKIVVFKGANNRDTNARIGFVKFKSYSEALSGLLKLNGAEIKRCNILIKPALVQGDKGGPVLKTSKSSGNSTSPDSSTAGTPRKNSDNSSGERSPRGPIVEMKWSNGQDGPPLASMPLSPQTTQDYYVLSSDAMCRDIREVNYQPNGYHKNTVNNQQAACTLHGLNDNTWSNNNAPDVWPQDLHGNITSNEYANGHLQMPETSKRATSSPQKQSTNTCSLDGSEDEGLASVTATLKQLEMSRSSSASFLSSVDITKWSVSDVVDYLENTEQCSSGILEFIKGEEINGNALLLLDKESVLPYLKLGPTLNLLDIVSKIKASQGLN